MIMHQDGYKKKQDRQGTYNQYDGSVKTQQFNNVKLANFTLLNCCVLTE
jgi:hypothetical protein